MTEERKMQKYPPDLPSVTFLPIITDETRSWITRVWQWWSERRCYKLNEDWRLNVSGTDILSWHENKELSRVDSIFIPKGFIFDGASVPRPFWFVFSPDHLLLIGSIIHDFGYRNKGLIVYMPNDERRYITYLTRKDFDWIFYKATTEYNGLSGLMLVPWLSVRTLGWFSYRRKGETNEC